MASINPVAQAVAANNQAASAYKDQMQKSGAATSALAAESSEFLNQKAADQALITTIHGKAQLETQQAVDMAGLMFGTDLRLSTEVLSGMTAELREAQGERIKAAQVIAQKKSVGLFDDPLQYFMNHLTINDDIDKYNGANAVIEARSQDIKTLNQLTQETAQTQVALKHSVTQASVDAAARVAAIDARVQANQQSIQSWIYGSEGVKAALTAAGEQLQGAQAIFSVQHTEESMAMQRAQFAQSQAEWADRREKLSLAKEGDEQVLKLINVGRVNRGAAPLDSLASRQLLALKSSTGSLPAMYADDYLAGERTATTGVRVVAAGPAQLLQRAETQGVQFTPAQAPIVSLLTQAKDAAHKSFEPGMANAGAKKTPQALAEALDQTVRTDLATYSKKIVAGDSSNPYNLGDIGEVIKSPLASGTLQKLPTVQKVLGPLMAAGKTFSDPREVVAAVTNAAAKGEIKLEQAAKDLSEIYRRGVLVNNATKNFEGFGLTPQSSYNAPIGASSTFHPFGGGSQVIDLTKEESIKRAMNKELARIAQQNLMRETTPGFIQDPMSASRTPLDAARAVQDWVNSPTSSYGDSMKGGTTKDIWKNPK